MDQQPPVIFVPAITASHLSDFYPLPPEEVWSQVIHKQWQRTAMHPLAHRFEAKQPALVRPTSIFQLVYADMLEALRSELQEPGRLTPVFPFAYDWRQDCWLSTGQLGAFIDEAIARTALLPHYKTEKSIQVDLVGHSMGGLLIAGYLASHPDAGKKVRRVVTMGTSFRGAVDALLKLIIGKGHLTGESPRDRERSAARTAQSLYQLLPDYDGAVQSKEEKLRHLFQPEAWQPSVVKGLAELIKEVDPGLADTADAEAARQFRKYLDTARAHRQAINGLNLDAILAGGARDWLGIVGIGSRTVVQVYNRMEDGKPRFQVPDDENQWPRDISSPHTGDGTVPFLGAVPGFLPKESLVCVVPNDFSRWEFRDRILAWSEGFHSFLPAVNLVQRLVTRHLKPSYGGDTWGWPPPTIDPAAWNPPPWLKKRVPKKDPQGPFDRDLWDGDYAALG